MVVSARAEELIERLGLAPHPEGGHFRELFRASAVVSPGDGRPPRSAITCIDFLLDEGEFSAWHRVASDEVWHLLEGGPLRLWLMPPSLDAVSQVDLAPVSEAATPRHVVPAGWWQAAQTVAGHALCGATVGPGFDFADFLFMRADAQAVAALKRLAPPLERLL